ncbi:MAG: hypothetical protein ACOX44_07920 [Limnochordia bacterium]
MDKATRDRLSDPEWVELAAAAMWLQKAWDKSVRNGVVEAINELFGR